MVIEIIAPLITLFLGILGSVGLFAVFISSLGWILTLC